MRTVTQEHIVPQPGRPRKTLRAIVAPALALCAALGCAGCYARERSAGSTPRQAPTRQQGAAGPRFEDAIPSSGISYRFHLPGATPRTILQTIGNGCAFLDYNADGNLDILLVGDPVALYAGDGHGHFREVTRECGLDKLSGHFLGCAVGDYDNDGFDDIYISGYRTGVLLHNEARQGDKETGRQGETAQPSTLNPQRVFRDVTQEAGLAPQPWGTSCAFADMTGSGRLDLFVGNYVQFGPDTVPQLCRTENGVMTACHPYLYKPLKGVLYQNLGGGRFADVTQAWGVDKTHGNVLGAAFADYDGAGRPALAIADDELPADLLRYENGKLQNAASASGIAYGADGATYAGMGIDWGDYNNDGRLDLAVTTFEVEAKPIFRQDAGGLFHDQSGPLGSGLAALKYLSFGIKWLDADNDGWLDQMIASGHIGDNVEQYLPDHSFRQPTLFFHNEGGRRLTDVSAQACPDFFRPIVGRGLAIGDYDNDGRMDALVVDSDGTPLLLHNVTTPAGHWLELNLVGTKSNRDGYGAVVTAQAGGLSVMRTCHADGSYLSSSDRRVHIGLGPAARVDTLTIRWPSGTKQVFQNVPADQMMTAYEDSRGLQRIQTSK